MQLRAALTALALAALPFAATALKMPVAAAPHNSTAQAAAPKAAAQKAAAPPAQSPAAEVAQLRGKLQKISVALEAMLGPQGNLANAEVAPTMRTFVKELHSTLAETAAPKDYVFAVKKLRAAQAGMADLTQALTKQQESLMHEGDAQEVSLLVGVLMTKKNEPQAKQLEVLTSAEFRNLPVSKELLAKKDETTPLFQQVAMWMDKHGGSDAGKMTKTQKLSKTLAYFQSRVETLEKEEARMQKVHAMSAKRYEDLIKTSSKREAKSLETMKKRSDRRFKKKFLVQQKQSKMMKDVVVALKAGDMKALDEAQKALQASMEAMQKTTGNFLHLLQLGHRLQRRDCPFCAAQCIDKCHTAGNPYTQCLTDCADSGK
mmetsp:Transcript_99987/g.287400  ORF Transcript_99987/g.287400 Transcript_99987/m.287400 type:complete len:374 (+) Transcript_99987:62-1183(+)